MFKYAILIPLIAGCGAVVTPKEVEQLNHVCDSNGGLEKAVFTSADNGDNEFRCADGAKFTLENVMGGAK